MILHSRFGMLALICACHVACSDADTSAPRASFAQERAQNALALAAEPRKAALPDSASASFSGLPATIHPAAAAKLKDAEVAWLFQKALEAQSSTADSTTGEPTLDDIHNELATLCALKEAGFSKSSCAAAGAALSKSGSIEIARKSAADNAAHVRQDDLGHTVFTFLDLVLANAIQGVETTAARNRNDVARQAVQSLQPTFAREPAEPDGVYAAAQMDAAKRASELAGSLRWQQLARARLDAARAVMKSELASYVRRPPSLR